MPNSEATAAEAAKVTVVVPAYRAERTITRTLDSILAEPAQARIVVVIDGAFDGTSAKVSDYPQDRVLVIDRRENWGASRTRNQGLAQATTPYVMFVDADDFVEDGLIAGLQAVMQDQGVDIGFGPMQILYERESRRLPRFMPNFTSPADAFRKWHGQGIYVNPTSVMWRTDFIRSIGGWDPEITRNDDGELVMRAILKGARIAVSAQGQGVYVQHSASTMNHRTDTMDSMVRANAKLVAIDPSAVGDSLQREVCAAHALTVAWNAYLAGRADVGAAAMAQSRALGSATWTAPLLLRTLVGFVGMKQAAALGRLAKRLRPQP